MLSVNEKRELRSSSTEYARISYLASISAEFVLILMTRRKRAQLFSLSNKAPKLQLELPDTTGRGTGSTATSDFLNLEIPPLFISKRISKREKAFRDPFRDAFRDRISKRYILRPTTRLEICLDIVGKLRV